MLQLVEHKPDSLVFVQGVVVNSVHVVFGTLGSHFAEDREKSLEEGQTLLVTDGLLGVIAHDSGEEVERSVLWTQCGRVIWGLDEDFGELEPLGFVEVGGFEESIGEDSELLD